MRARVITAIASGMALLASGGLLVGSASAATATPVASVARAPSAVSIQQPGAVSQAPVSWTPNVFAGSPKCDAQWFGSGRDCAHSTVYSMAVVNGEVVVAGAFTQACQPGPASSGNCAPGTLVTRDDIFAYQLGTGVIDPNFTPVLDKGPVYSVVAGPNNTVYVGGAFTQVNGVAHAGLVQLSVAPGDPSDGQVVPAFDPQFTGFVHDIAVNGSAIYAGGQYTAVDGASKNSIARLNATTGALDKSFKFALGDRVTTTALQVEKVALTADGNTLAIAGTFQTVNGQSIPRVALINTGGGFGSTATLDNWSAPILANFCSKQHDYVRGIAFSPDGSYFVIADTGYMSAGGPALCDAAARFETGATGTDVQPTWANYAGGDSFYSVAVTGSVVYVGGHNRWVNNECGNNVVCESNAVLVNGVAALDPNTGLAMPWWHPNTLRGAGVVSLVPFGAGSYAGSNGGLLLGTDVTSIGGVYHSKNALFPLTSTASHVAGGPILSGIFSQGRLGGGDESSAGVPAMCVDDAGNATTPGTPVQLTTCQNDAEQNWTIKPDGTIRINAMCLGTAGGGTAGGTLTVLNTCNGSGTQVWTQGAGNTLVNQGSGLCLDDPNASTTNNTQLQILACDGNIQQVWPLPAGQAPPPPPPTGQVYPSETQHSSQVPCMDNANYKAVPGNKVILETCTGSTAEQWTMEANGTFQNHGMCLDTSGGQTFQGDPIVVNTCNGGSTQVWMPGPSGRLLNQAANLCLDDPGLNTRNGTQLQLYSCNGGTNQHWWLPEV